VSSVVREFILKGLFMDYIRIAKINDFKNKHIKSFSLFGKKIGVVKRKDNSFYAIEISCKHQGADLTAGKIDGTVATCHRHQWKYDLETGKCLNHDSPDLKKYDIQLKGEDLWISFLPLDEWFT